MRAGAGDGATSPGRSGARSVQAVARGIGWGAWIRTRDHGIKTRCLNHLATPHRRCGAPMVGRGAKRLLLGGLREYDSEAMDAAIADFDRRKKDYFNG